MVYIHILRPYSIVLPLQISYKFSNNSSLFSIYKFIYNPRAATGRLQSLYYQFLRLYTKQNIFLIKNFFSLSKLYSKLHINFQTTQLSTTFTNLHIIHLQPLSLENISKLLLTDPIDGLLGSYHSIVIFELDFDLAVTSCPPEFHINFQTTQPSKVFSN